MRRSCSGLTFMTGTLHTLWRVRKPCTRACRSGARSVRSPPAPHRGSSRPDRFRGAPGSHDCTCPHASTRVPDCTAPPGHFLDPSGSRRPGSVCVVPAFRRALDLQPVRSCSTDRPAFHHSRLPEPLRIAGRRAKSYCSRLNSLTARHSDTLDAPPAFHALYSTAVDRRVQPCCTSSLPRIATRSLRGPG